MSDTRPLTTASSTARRASEDEEEETRLHDSAAWQHFHGAGFSSDGRSIKSLCGRRDRNGRSPFGYVACDTSRMALFRWLLAKVEADPSMILMTQLNPPRGEVMQHTPTAATNVRARVRGCVGAWVRGCVGAWAWAWACVCKSACVCVHARARARAHLRAHVCDTSSHTDTCAPCARPNR